MTTLDERTVPEFDQARYDEGRYDGIIEIPNRTGDLKIMWDRRNDVEVAAAQAAFDQAVKDKALIYKAEGKEGTRGEQVKKFDKKHERLIVAPQLVGG
jgi:hypothetical protein